MSYSEYQLSVACKALSCVWHLIDALHSFVHQINTQQLLETAKSADMLLLVTWSLPLSLVLMLHLPCLLLQTPAATEIRGTVRPANHSIQNFMLCLGLPLESVVDNFFMLLAFSCVSHQATAVGKVSAACFMSSTS